MSDPMLALQAVSRRYGGKHVLLRRGDPVSAVKDVTLTLCPGETLGIVGESGSGKSTLGRIAAGIEAPSEGRVTFDGEPYAAIDTAAWRRQRKTVQVVFQNPSQALDPRLAIAAQIHGAMAAHRIDAVVNGEDKTQTLLARVGLAGLGSRFPHQLSGGQLQRAVIARALALSPRLIVCDEAVSALDVSVQAQILNLLKDLQTTLGLTYLFVSHNLAVVDYMADRIAVMCGGRIVELAPAGALFRNPLHPYTKALLAAVPEPDLAHPLDFGRLMDERASNPAAWPEPFAHDPQRPTQWLELGDGHFVRARPSAALEKLVA